MGQRIVVATGKAIWHKFNKGTSVTLVSRALTICSAMTIQGRNASGQVVGYIMIHRGGQRTDLIKKEIEAAVRQGKLAGVTKWNVKALQTARSTKTSSDIDPDGIHDGIHGNCTDVVLANEVKDVVRPEESEYEMNQMSKVGPDGDDGIPQSAIDIDSEGDCSYSERSGLNWTCTIM